LVGSRIACGTGQRDWLERAGVRTGKRPHGRSGHRNCLDSGLPRCWTGAWRWRDWDRGDWRSRRCGSGWLRVRIDRLDCPCRNIRQRRWTSGDRLRTLCGCRRCGGWLWHCWWVTSWQLWWCDGLLSSGAGGCRLSGRSGGRSQLCCRIAGRVQRFLDRLCGWNGGAQRRHRWSERVNWGSRIARRQWRCGEGRLKISRWCAWSGYGVIWRGLT
jgi:hypothetical protein